MAETPSGYLPDLDIEWGFTFGEDFSTEVETYRSGREVRRIMTGNSYRRWKLTNVPISQTDRQTLYNFLKAKQGKFQSFYFWRPDTAMFTGYSVGTITALSAVIIPFKAVTVTAVYVGGVSKVFTQQDNIGAGGESQITFTGGAQTGAFTIDVSLGRERVVVRNTNDAIDQEFEQNAAQLWARFTLELKEVK